MALFKSKDNQESGSKQKKSLTHAERLTKSVKETKESLLLMILLLLILVGWNFWTRKQVKELRAEISIHEEVRRDLEQLVTPEFANRALRQAKIDEEEKDLRKFIEELIAPINVQRDEKEFINRPKTVNISRTTKEEYVVVKSIVNIEMDRLVTLLTSIRAQIGNVWCTEIDGLEPLRDEDGFAVVTTQGKPVHNIKQLRISRFSEIKE